jgi:hypothetical protein
MNSEEDAIRLGIEIKLKLAKLKAQSGLSDVDRIALAREGKLQASPESYAAHNAFAAQEQAAADRAAIADAGGLVGAGAMKAAQGIPFVGEYVDEAAGAIGGPAARDRARFAQGAMDRQYPKTALGLQIGGAVLGSLPAAGVAGPLARLAPTGVGAQMAAGAALGSAGGAIEGGISGYGSGTDPASRREAAKTRAAVGGGAGALLGAVAPAVGVGVRKAIEHYKAKDTRLIAKELGISKDAAEVIKGYVKNDDYDAALAEIRKAGDSGMLADGGAGIAQLLDTVMSGGGPGLRVGIKATDARVKQSMRALNNAMDGILGKPAGARAVQKDISMRTAGMRRAAYDRAYSQPIDYASDMGREIEDIFAWVEPDVMREAVKEANAAMRFERIQNRQIMASIADDGTVTFTQMPDMRQADALKQALRTIAENETDKVTGAISKKGLRAKKQSRDLAKALSANDAYRVAARLGGDKIEEQDAADLGRRLLKPATTREEVEDFMKAIRPGKAKPGTDVVPYGTRVSMPRDKLAEGMRSHIDDTLANVTRTIGGGSETEMQEAMKAVKMMSSRAAREKAETALGAQKARVLFKYLDEAGKHLETRLAVARGSQTAIRTSGQAGIDNILEPGIFGRALRAQPIGAGKEVVKVLTGRTGAFDQQRKLGLYKEIADALTTKKGPEAVRAMDIMQRAIEGQPVKDADAAYVARVLTTTGALALHQAGTRGLAK